MASDESVVTISSEVSAPSASDPNASTFRAKLQVARKRLEEMERKVHELESRLAKETQELQYVSAERDRSVDALTKQVKELTARLEYNRPQGASTVSCAHVFLYDLQVLVYYNINDFDTLIIVCL